jgi:uncharacterized membrane protein
MKFYHKITDELQITPSVFFLVTSHHPPCQLNRTWRFNIFGHKVYICTRCLGQNSAIVFSLLSILVFGFRVDSISAAILFFGILPFPATIDWLTQTMGWRESINAIRITTGFLYGVSIGICLGCILTFNLKALLFAVIFYPVYLLVVLGILRRYQKIPDYLQPYEDFLRMDNLA